MSEWKPVDYVLDLGIPKDVAKVLAKMVEDAKSFMKSAHTILKTAEGMKKGGYDVPELSVLIWQLEGCMLLADLVARRLSEPEGA